MQINLVPDLSLLAVMAIFVVEYFIVKRFFLKPINDVLESRETEARTSQQLHEKALEQLSEATNQIEARLRETRRGAAQLRDQFRTEAGAHRASLVERTTTEGKRIVTEAEQRLASDVKEAREKLQRDAEALARFAAEKILGRRV
jgi:F-type H+-transporting ATPase subunit b